MDNWNAILQINYITQCIYLLYMLMIVKTKEIFKKKTLYLNYFLF